MQVFSAKLIDLGLDSFFQRQVTDADSKTTVPVRVMNVHRSGIHIVGDNIDQYLGFPGNTHTIECTSGDWLLFDPLTQRVVRRLDRKSLFTRRAPGTDRREQLIAANIDTLFIVSSCNQDFNEARLERYLAIARAAQVMPVIVLTKADLVDDPQEFIDRARKLALGVQVEAVNALQVETLSCLEPWLKGGQTVALLGSSGVGKSTLTNTFAGTQDVTTQPIREDDARGRHTTTSRSMHQLQGGAWLLDTPGMRELQLTGVKTGIEDVFAEISELAEACRFTDCAHENEPGCAIQRAINEGGIEPGRLARWRKLAREEALNSRTIAERRARDKKLGRLYKTIINDKKAKKGY
jgi:ribosome biogenesis GTPase